MGIENLVCRDWLYILRNFTDKIIEALDTTGKNYLDYDVLEAFTTIFYYVFTKCLPSSIPTTIGLVT